MFKKIGPKSYWTGSIDWALKKFHGDELSTAFGTAYNSYVIKDEKTVVLDTVYHPFSTDFVENLKELLDPSAIDYIIINHAEPDHAGAIKELIAVAPQAQIVCSAKGVNSIQGNYHINANFKTVKSGDTLNIGSQNLHFVEMSMLHWPDSMATFADGDKILFSNDAFGQHYASDMLYADLVDQWILEYESLKYFANILSPYVKQAKKKVEELIAANLPIEVIAPSHGMIWRKNPLEIVQKYLKWADSYSENQVTIAYDTMYESTRIMAEAIADGIRLADPDVTIKIYNCVSAERSDIITEMFRSKKILVGSPNINSGILGAMAALLEEIRGHNLGGKKAASFTSYGWSPVATKMMNARLIEGGLDVVNEGLKIQWKPDAKGIQECREFGKNFILA